MPQPPDLPLGPPAAPWPACPPTANPSGEAPFPGFVGHLPSELGGASLPELMNQWTLWALLASEHLVRLYRSLGDDRQAASAMLAAGPCEERARRLGLAYRTAPGSVGFLEGQESETDREAACWAFLVQAHAGVLAFHTVVDPGAASSRGLRGSRSATAKALRRALQGFRTAFPEELAGPWIRGALAAALERFSGAFTAQVRGADDTDRPAIKHELQEVLFGSLLDEFPDMGIQEPRYA